MTELEVITVMVGVFAKGLWLGWYLWRRPNETLVRTRNYIIRTNP